MSEPLKILIVGDVVGKAGRTAVLQLVPKIVAEHGVEFVIVNGENAAHGRGMNQDCVRDVLRAGAHVITGGNHSFDNRAIIDIFPTEPRLLRPANWGQDVPGRGVGVYDVPSRPGIRVGVINLMGRIHMPSVDCPFRAASSLVETMRRDTPIIVVDFHAEATSEKVALSWHLDGEVSCVYGTHTHVQTADNRVLPRGTAAMTDVGMTGGHDGVIGVQKDAILHKFLTNMPARHEPAIGDVRLHGCVLTVDPDSGRALTIRRVAEPLDE